MVSYYLPQVFCICYNPDDIIIIPEYPVIPTAGKGQHIIICYVRRENLDIQRPGELVAETIDRTDYFQIRKAAKMTSGISTR